MTAFDIVVSIIIAISVLLSLFKGFIREVFSLLSYIGGYLMAVKYQGTFSQILMESIPSKPIAKLIAFAGIYILTAIIISLMGKVAKGMIFSTTELSKFDRLMGGVVGFARGAMIVVAITFPLQFFPDISKKLTQDSYTAPYLAEVLTFISQNPEAMNFRKNLTDFNMDGVKEKFEELKNIKNLADHFNELKEKLPGLGEKIPGGSKPQDQYSKEDLQKLDEILKSVEKK